MPIEIRDSRFEMADGGDEQIEGCRLDAVKLDLPSFFARPADGKVQLQSHLTSHCEAGNLGRTSEEEAAARLIPSRPFAGAAEEVDPGSQSSRIACWLCWMGKLTSVGRAGLAWGGGRDNFRMGSTTDLATATITIAFCRMWLASRLCVLITFPHPRLFSTPGL